MTVFDDAIAVELVDEDRFRATTSEHWRNMVGPFGGITAATVLEAILRHPECAGEPLALTVNYTAPLSEGDWELQVVPMRTNRSNQHWMVTGEQDGEVVVTATAVTAAIRDTWRGQDTQVPSVPAPADVAVTPMAWPLPWLQRYEMRFVAGGLPPAVDQRDSTSTFWLAQGEERPWDYTSIAAAADAFFPRAFLRTGLGTATGTISLTTYFHGDAEELADAGRHLLLHADASRYGNGAYDQTGRLFSADGVLLASTTQVVYFKPDARAADPQA